MTGMGIRRSARGAAALGLAVALLAGCQGNPRPGNAPGAEREVDTGYGMLPEREATGATAAALADELDEQPVERVEQLIRGRFAGVQVIQLPSGSYSIRIRGTQSVMGGSEPLLVIDGMPISFGMQSALAQLNPRDVERIEILKDAAATSMYGVRGANGVILIRTKRAR